MTSLCKTIALAVAFGCVLAAAPLRSAEAVPLRAFLSGDEESPPVDTRAIGVASATFEEELVLPQQRGVGRLQLDSPKIVLRGALTVSVMSEGVHSGHQMLLAYFSALKLSCSAS